MFSLREIFNLAIQIERNGEQFYRDALKKVSNVSLISLLEWLVDEEVKHREWFTQKKETVKTGSEDLQLEKMGSDLLQDILGDQSFSLKEADLSKIDRVDALLELAIEFEKDSILFYEMIGVFIDDEETAGHLNVIMEEENRHIQLLQDFQDTGANRHHEGDAK
jgi:rubrerythrin